MSLSRLGLSLGLGGGTAATSSGAPLAVAAASSDDFCGAFDGYDSYVDLGTNSSLEIAGSNHSVSLWFRHTESVNAYKALLSLGAGGERLAVTLGNTAEKVSYCLQSPGPTWDAIYGAGSGMNDGNWHHFAATVTGGAIQIYVDGSAASGTEGDIAVGNYNRIGDGHYGNYGGDLDSIAIFTSALSSSDISAIYSAGRNGALGSYSPTSWWKMGDSDSGAGTTLTDEVGSNTGTLTNGAYFTSALNVAFSGFSIGNESPSFVGSAFDRDLFDGNATGSWYAYDGSYQNTGWVGQDFGAGNEKTVVKYRMLNSLANLTYPPKDWTFEGSADSASWTVLDTQTGVTDWEQATTSNYAEKWKEYTFSNSTAYRYYRLNVSANNGHASLLILSELEMYE